MNIEDIHEYCVLKRGVTVSFPFDNNTLVFKVMDKMFVLLNLEGSLRMNLKCEPGKGVELREQYNAVQPGYHMNKEHWNTVFVDGTISDKIIYKWLDDSYDLVLKKLSRTKSEELKSI